MSPPYFKSMEFLIDIRGDVERILMTVQYIMVRIKTREEQFREIAL